MDSFKLVVVGDMGVGKSAFLERYQHGTFLTGSNGTTEMKTREIVFHTTRGKVSVQCWDSNGSEGELFNASVGIIMFDLTNRESFESIGKYYEKMTKMSPNVFVILVGNKCDKNRVVKTSEIKNVMGRFRIGKYCDLSVKANFNFEKPFLYALRHVCGDSKLNITFGEDEE